MSEAPKIAAWDCGTTRIPGEAFVHVPDQCGFRVLGRTTNEALSLAQKIAAVPVLIDALQTILGQSNDSGNLTQSEKLEKACRAISIAEGGAA